MPGHTLDHVRSTTLFDSGPYTFTVQSLDEGETRAGHFAYKAVLVCTEGKDDFIGANKYETFTMGTPDDPTWNKPETVGPGASGFKKFLQGLGIETEGRPVDEMVPEAIGGTVGGIIEKKLDNGGVMRDNVTRWYPAAAPSALPAATAKRAAPVVAGAKATIATPKAAAQRADPLVPCRICNTSVPRSQYGLHVQEHEA